MSDADESILPQHREAVARGAQCLSCPLYGCKQGPVMPRLQERSMMLVVSESPSLSDVESGKPLQGHTGETLNESLAAGNVSRADCSVTYAVLCRPPGGHVLDYAMTLRKAARKSAKASAAAGGGVGGSKGQKAVSVSLPQDCCAPRLARDFAEVDTRVILTLGSESLKAAARTLKLPFGATKSPPGSVRVASLRKQLGAPVLAPTGQTLIATLHPAFVMGGMATFQHVMRQDIERAASLAQRGGRIHWHEPEAILKPSADTAVNVMEAMRQSGALVTVDIETDGIDTMRCHVRCVGLGAVLDGREVVIVIPLRHMSGLPWWSPAQEARVTAALTRLLEEAPLAGHNLSFDTAVLLNNVLMKNRNKCWMDTLIASKNTFRSELPHDLGFVSSRYFEAPHWKDDADAKSVSGVDDYWLHRYCLYQGTPVVMADGSTKSIEDLVRNQSTDKVLALKDGKIVTRSIYGWHKQKVKNQKWVVITVEKQREVSRGLTCTPDHKILTDSGWKQAGTVRVGDMLYLPEQKITKTARQAILGTLLGDSSLVFSPCFRHKKSAALGASIKGGHTVSSGLAENKRKTYPDLFTKSFIKPGRMMTVAGRSGLGGEFQHLTTTQYRQLVDLYPLLADSDGRRRLRIEVLEQLGPAGLAWWFMDDGCVQKGQKTKAGGRCPDGVTIATQRYPREDIDAAAEWFTQKFGGRVKAYGDKVLRFNQIAARAFAEHIAPFVYPEQNYKLPSRIALPEFNAASYGNCFTGEAIQTRVIAVQPLAEPRDKAERYQSNHRYCIDVEDAHNFFTPWGLVHNCAADILGTMRLVPRLLERVDVDGTLNSFRTDTRLGPIVRDMGDLGLTLNEERRLTHFKTLDLVADARGKEVCRVVGDSSFNPNATHQVSKFLYITKGLSPPFTTDGIEWSEVNDDSELPIDTSDPDTIIEHASTDEAALLKLLDLGVDTETAAFIEALLAYRGLRKCCSTFLGYKWRDEEKGGGRGSGRILVDTFRERGFIREESWGPGLENLSVLHPSWRPSATATGRFTVKPNVQAWPERVVFDVDQYRVSDGKDGILNTRSIVVAPPGYVLVGADLAAVELRLYAMFSRDALLLDAIAHGKDPHALNYATMQSSRPADMEVWYQRVLNSKPPVKKYLRNIAKRFCIAEGELVLVRRAGAVLEVPIEKVLGTDEVWDGVEWVTHDGVIFQGIKEVIFHDGLWATADHEVFLADGRTCTHGEAKHRALRLARGSESGRPVRLVDSSEGSADATRVETVCPGEVREVRTREGGAAGEHSLREVEGLSRVLLRARELASVALESLLAGEATMRAEVSSMLERLRRAWHRISLQVCSSGDTMGARECRAEGGVVLGPDRQRWPLRAGEHSLHDRRKEHGESSGVSTSWLAAVARLRLHREGLALSRVMGEDVDSTRVDARSNSRSSTETSEASISNGAGTHRLVGGTPGTQRRWTKVFDIVNAGPRRRFTVSNRIVKNCFLILYGGEAETLFKTMAADRNPDGTRSFPDLKFSDVQMWTANWHRLHPETKAWHDAILRAWQQHGFVASLIDGRRRFFLGGIQDRNAILNAPVQSSTAAIANRALIAIAAACPHRGWGPMAGPMLQVHDFIGIQVPVERQKEAEDLLIREIPYEHNGMRFDVEQKSGPSWDKT